MNAPVLRRLLAYVLRHRGLVAWSLVTMVLLAVVDLLLPEVVKRAVEANYPAYKTPPPGDDQRPNETSWTYFKRRMAARKK